MSLEIRMLGWATLLGLVHILLAGFLATQQRGYRWNVGNRDGEPAPLTGLASRAGRASANFLETFVFFAAASVAVVAAARSSAHTALAAQVYFWARLAYLPVYLAGIPYLRTAIWIVGFWGMLQLIWALL
jgi:uncharacterized MAPEG superfamily protein